MAGRPVGKFDFNENPVIPLDLDLDLDLGFVNTYPYKKNLAVFYIGHSLYHEYVKHVHAEQAF